MKKNLKSKVALIIAILAENENYGLSPAQILQIQLLSNPEGRL